MSNSTPDTEWQQQWDERVQLLERQFGSSDGVVGHSPIPFYFGADAGGAADILYFRHWKPGVLSVTANLLGEVSQVRNALGWYELAICHRTDEAWGPSLISRLAHYTLDSPLEPGDTMDIGSAVPEGSSIRALLFLELCRFVFRGEQAGVLLCIGITSEELHACRESGSSAVYKHLVSDGAYPYTDLSRKPVVSSKKRWGLF